MSVRSEMVAQPMSRVVPIVVAAGLAVGVFCGLLFGLGTGRSKAPEHPTPTPEPSAAAAPAPKPEPSVTAIPTTAPAPPATPGSGAGPAKPTIRTAKITVELKPTDLMGKAKIKIDGVDVPTGVLGVELGAAGKKQVKLVIKAPGYSTVEQSLEINDDTTVRFELVKRSNGGLKRPPPPGDKPPGAGLIDI